VNALLVALGRFFFKFRNVLFPLVFLGLVALDRPRLAGGSWRSDFWIGMAGIAIALGGHILRVTTIGYAYVRRGGLQKKVHADRLVQEGMFAHSRNPLYLGNLLALVGFMIVYHGVWVYAVGLPFSLLAYRAIVAAEEDFLRRKFGAEYEEYCARVPRFWPRLAGLRRSLAPLEFDWRRVLRKEYGSTVATVTMLLALLVWERWAIDGRKAGLRMLETVIPIELLLLLAYFVVRLLKKTGRLGSGSAETPAPPAAA